MLASTRGDCDLLFNAGETELKRDVRRASRRYRDRLALVAEPLEMSMESLVTRRDVREHEVTLVIRIDRPFQFGDQYRSTMYDRLVTFENDTTRDLARGLGHRGGGKQKEENTR